MESAAGPTGWQFGLYESPARSEGSLFDLARDVAALTLTTAGGFEARAFTSASPAGERTSALGVVLAWRPPDRPFGLRLGWLDERESLLGSMAEGAFGRLSSASIVAGLEGSAGLDGWRLATDIEVGAAIPRAEGGIVTGLSQATTSAVALRATRRLSTRDTITLSLSQPPRIERGTARCHAAGRPHQGGRGRARDDPGRSAPVGQAGGPGGALAPERRAGRRAAGRGTCLAPSRPRKRRSRIGPPDGMAGRVLRRAPAAALCAILIGGCMPAAAPGEGRPAGASESGAGAAGGGQARERRCPADRYRDLVGQAVGEIDLDALPKPLRVYAVGSPITMDHRQERMNIIVGRGNLVRAVRCG